ncbi:hypothetical protein TUM4644_36900 [Shewanella colwelliana]|uniref:ImmA/IrrE family metallo-endopeptidase n=1 Tax=Shewanella colwelliana TaxID=23 RepID=UPI001BC75782|nr:ImmA/IrrE family metallo-endopeptidase [Shewanella colwelliana]GIU35713.1 hypothetical protein TUM4644_36900 [Shewanella colwelliana]
MTNPVEQKITLEQLSDIDSAQCLLETLYSDIREIVLPIDVDFIAKSIEKVKLFDDLDFEHLDKAGFIKVNRNSNDDVNFISIWVNPLEVDVRQRFTKAHEIGHLIYDIAPELSNPKVDDSFIDVLHRKEGVSSFRETRANRFSAQLLMPAILVKREIDALITEVRKADGKITKENVVLRLSSIFNTSTEAMRYRLNSLRIL